MLLRLERTLSFDQVLTAAEAASNALFRELFPTETLRADQLMNVATVTLLSASVSDPDELYTRLGDARAFEVLQRFEQTVSQEVGQCGGAVFEADDTHVLAAFKNPADAVRAAMRLKRAVAASNQLSQAEVGLRVGVHAGTALVATAARGVAYYGRSVALTRRLLELAGNGEMLFTEVVSGDPQVAAMLQREQVAGDAVPIRIAGRNETLATRIV